MIGVSSREIRFFTRVLKLGTDRERWARMNPLAKWFVLARGVAFPITLLAFLLGLSFSLLHAPDAVRADLAAVTLLGLLLAHGASNLWNDWWDARNRIDSPDYFRNRYNLHPLALIGAEKLRNLAIATTLLALAAGIYLAFERGWPVLGLAGAGFLIMFIYSGKPLKLKYWGLGEPLVFLTWGPLLVGGTLTVLVGEWPAWVWVASAPYGLSAMLVLLGKHIDKLDEDANLGVKTLPVVLGHRGAIRFSVAMILLVHLSVFALPFTGICVLAPWFTLLALPRSIACIRGALAGKPSPENLPDFYPREFWPLWYTGGGYLINRQFGTLLVLGLLADFLLKSV